MKVSSSTRYPAAFNRPAADRDASSEAPLPSSSTGFFADRRTRAASSTMPAATVALDRRTTFGPVTLVSSQAVSAGRIRLADPPGGP
jgi:hypothetical protein